MEADRAIIFGPMRLPFLVLPPACVALGAATAAWSGSEINLFYLLIALIGAVSAHISVNALNEYLVSDLLLLNQFPDVEADKKIGRCHLPIVIGKNASVKVYSAFLAAAYGSIILGYLAGVLPLGSLVALASIFLAVTTVQGVARHADDIPKLIPYMGRNVVINILTPVLLAIGLFADR